MLVALRSLRKSPGLTTSVILLLGFGIGANTALFSVVHAVLLAGIPGAERSAELVRLRRTQNGRAQGNASYPDYVSYRDHARTLAGMAAERLIQMRLSGPPAQMLPAAIVTGNYFSLIGVRARAGRLLTPEDDRVPGGHAVAVISERFWRRQFAADPGTVGRSLILNSYPFTVIGVAADFEGVEFAAGTEVWIPMMMVRQAMPRNPDYRFLEERRAGWLTYYGRLKPGVDPKAADAELKTIARGLEAQYPETNRGRGIRVEEGADRSVENRATVRGLLALISVAVILVLVIACGNVACLLLARTAARGREMAIRVALGAGRAALLKQLFTEGLLVAAGGAALGLLLAPWMAAGLRLSLRWQGLTRADAAILDPRVLAFTAAVSLSAVLLFGLAPAWFALRTDPAGALKESAQGGGGRSKLQSAWVVAQVALSVALVAGGSLVLRSMQRIAGIDPGYRPQPIVMATIDLSLAGYPAERGTEFLDGLTERVSRIPGVRSVSLGKSSPAIDWSDRVTVFREGEEPAVGAASYAEFPGAMQVNANLVAPGYFRTLGIPLVSGRDFTRTDTRATRLVAIVSQGLADRLWPGLNPIGRRLLIPVERQPRMEPLEVIGVAADSRYRNVLDVPAPLLYTSVLQRYDSIARVIAAVDGDPARFKGALRRTIEQADPELPVASVATMEEQIAQGLWRQRAATLLLSFFGVLALALACAGIYGVVAYTVARRAREIGIRMALGAGRNVVVRRVMAQALRLAAVGIALGLPLAFWARPALASFLYGAGSLEPVAFAGVPLLFMVVALAASLVPARRAATIDPMTALRDE